MKKIMVTGSRGWGSCEHIHPNPGDRWECPQYFKAWHDMLRAIHPHLPGGLEPVELLHGDAKGADRMAVEIWRMYTLGPITGFPANWEDLGKRAGHVRNGILVAHMPDVVLAFHLNNSPGTADAIGQARKAGLKVEIYPKES